MAACTCTNSTDKSTCMNSTNKAHAHTYACTHTLQACSIQNKLKTIDSNQTFESMRAYSKGIHQMVKDFRQLHCTRFRAVTPQLPKLD